jgi:hypothetical protein
LTLTPSHAESLYKQQRGQVLLKLLASYACAEYPLALYITDGQRFNRLKVQSRRVVFWTSLTAAQALYLIRQDLVHVSHVDDFTSLATPGDTFSVRQAPTKLDFRLEECDARMDAEERESLRLLRSLRGTSALAEQLETVMGHLEDPEERIVTALSLIHEHQACMAREKGQYDVPQWLQHMYS